MLTERRIVLASLLRRHAYFIAVAIAAFVLDQTTKWAVISTVPLYESVPERGFFRITHIPNTGSAFGFVGDANGILTIAASIGIAVIALVYGSQRSPNIVVRTSLALMLAGALGNLVDRIIHGHVTDFIDIGPWYIFNLADASIVSGVIALIASPLIMKPRPRQDAPADDADDGPATAEGTASSHPAAPADGDPVPTPTSGEAKSDELGRG